MIIKGGKTAALADATMGGMEPPAVERHLLPVRVLAIALAAIVLVTNGCATYKPTVPPSKGHINADQFPDKSADDKILPPVTTSNYVPPPKPQVKAPTYSVVVNEVPVKELLFALSRDTRQNIDVHPSIQGLVSLNAIDETLPAILERIAQQVNIRYKTEGKTIVVLPDLPYFRTYKVNYVNMSRDTASSIGVSGEITGTVVAATGQQSGSQSSGNTSNTKVDSKATNNFWDILRQNIESILAASKAVAQSADQRAARGESERAAREERIAQAEAVSRAGSNAASLFSAAFGPASTTPTDAKNEIVVNPVTGTISVLGTEKQQILVQQYLDSVTASSQRQVLIEATIAEVTLSNNYQAGVDWSRFTRAAGDGFKFQQSLIGTNLAAPPVVALSYANQPGSNPSFSAMLKLLEQFGNTRVLSSPKLMAINNQTALLKVVDNLVYFAVEAQTQTSANVAAITTFTSTAKTVPVGLVMSVTPQIGDSGSVSLTVRPTISRRLRDVLDPNPDLARANVQNLVPEIQVREMESVLQVYSGNTIVLGGLMQDNVSRNRDALPGVGKLPSPIGDVFSYRDEQVSKTELIIFIKPTVISNPSLDSDELKSFRRFLPVVDPTGKNP
ncbi:MAG TPA: secretin N-terminal domain-containing protein [Burkholderiales bacterium]|nr:secretin N-terminal domain-containing protein [Burkholderiales bacterium]